MDVKVAGFSPTHTALKTAIPAAARRFPGRGSPGNERRPSIFQSKNEPEGGRERTAAGPPFLS